MVVLCTIRLGDDYNGLNAKRHAGGTPAKENRASSSASDGRREEGGVARRREDFKSTTHNVNRLTPGRGGGGGGVGVGWG